MVPLDSTAAREVITRLGPPAEPGLLALRHALTFRRPGLWGDTRSRPQSVIFVREGDGQIEAFGAGDPGPAVEWLVGHRRGFTLSAPDAWLDAVRDRLGKVEEDEVETWSGGSRLPAQAKAPPGVVTRRLTLGDVAAFNALVPPWGLRGWGSFAALIEHGAAVGVPHGRHGFAALAWVFDQADPYDALGVYTLPRYRRLGLGRAAARALCEHRGRVSIWSTPADNEPSRCLARALGFVLATSETLVRWALQSETGARR